MIAVTDPKLPPVHVVPRIRVVPAYEDAESFPLGVRMDGVELTRPRGAAGLPPPRLEDARVYAAGVAVLTDRRSLVYSYADVCAVRVEDGVLTHPGLVLVDGSAPADLSRSPILGDHLTAAAVARGARGPSRGFEKRESRREHGRSRRLGRRLARDGAAPVASCASVDEVIHLEAREALHRIVHEAVDELRDTPYYAGGLALEQVLISDRPDTSTKEVATALGRSEDYVLRTKQRLVAIVERKGFSRADVASEPDYTPVRYRRRGRLPKSRD